MSPTDTPQRLILRETAARRKLGGVSQMSFWRWRKHDPTFPQPVRLGPQLNGYFEDELDRWAESRRVSAMDRPAQGFIKDRSPKQARG